MKRQEADSDGHEYAMLLNKKEVRIVAFLIKLLGKDDGDVGSIIAEMKSHDIT